MASSLNQVTLMGNLTRDPELRKTQNGTSVAGLSLALNEVRIASDGTKSETVTYVDISVWGATGETCAKYLRKGRAVLVEGRIRTESWADKETGKNRYRTYVKADKVHFLSSGERRGQQPGGSAGSSEAAPAEPSAKDPEDPYQDMPF